MKDFLDEFLEPLVIKYVPDAMISLDLVVKHVLVMSREECVCFGVCHDVSILGIFSPILKESALSLFMGQTSPS